VEALTAEHPSYHLSLTLEDGKQLELSAQNVVVANGRYVAGGVPVAPNALLDDGLLNLLAVPDLEFGEMAALLPRLLAGEHPDHPHLLVRTARKVALRSEPALDLSLDGEGAQATELTLKVAQGALNVVTGPEVAPGAFQDS
jgi:diacylglycerol kinase family enzyme